MGIAPSPKATNEFIITMKKGRQLVCVCACVCVCVCRIQGFMQDWCLGTMKVWEVGDTSAHPLYGCVCVCVCGWVGGCECVSQLQPQSPSTSPPYAGKKNQQMTFSTEYRSEVLTHALVIALYSSCWCGYDCN